MVDKFEERSTNGEDISKKCIKEGKKKFSHQDLFPSRNILTISLADYLNSISPARRQRGYKLVGVHQHLHYDFALAVPRKAEVVVDYTISTNWHSGTALIPKSEDE